MAELLKTIPEYYSKKNIFITGGTGFVGKMLIERILRTCPDVGTIYLLIRETRGIKIEERWEKVKQDTLYNNVKEVNPNCLNKIKLVKGDILELKLGLSDEDRKEIMENVSIIFHIAASINFGLKLSKAIICNVRGTREACDLMLSLKNPEALCHVSTAFCHINLEKIEERMYLRERDWKEMIALAENLSEDELTIISEKIRMGYPNTYTYTKCLAETCVYDMCSGKFPTSILRPTIVVPAAQHPFKGWTDNLYALSGVCVLCVLGLGRYLMFIKDQVLHFVSVDVVAENLLKIVWYQQNQPKNSPTSVYNNSIKISFLPQDLSNLTCGVAENYPISFLYPNVKFLQSLFLFRVLVIIYELIPFALIDFIAKMMKKKPIAVIILRKMVRELLSNRYFYNGDLHYNFELEKIDEIDEKLMPSDRESFIYDESNFDLKEQMESSLEHMLKYIIPNVKKSKTRLRWLKIFFYAYTIMEYYFLFYILYKYIIPLFINFIYANVISY